MSAELRDLTVHVDTGRWKETVLEGVDLVVPAGQIIALIGESGCGKSMVAATLTGLLPASAHRTGQVHINGAVVESQRQLRSLCGRVIGYVPQAGATAFDPDETVGAQLHELERRHRKWSVDRAIGAAHYPTDALDLYPHEHSGGQIQRAALAAALLPAPELLIVDEPTSSLDRTTAVGVWSTLRAYADAGAGLLTITHDVGLLAATGVADRITLMRGGRVAVAGPANDVSAFADPYVQGFFTL